MLALYWIVTMAAVVLDIIVCVKLIQDGKVAAGIIGIFCGIVTLIVGWQNADRLGLKNIMIAFTVATIASIVLRFTVVGVAMTPH
jgi:hypothetical protein